MISDEKCKQILNSGSRKYANEEIKQIKEILVLLAKLEAEQFKKQK